MTDTELWASVIQSICFNPWNCAKLPGVDSTKEGWLTPSVAIEMARPMVEAIKRETAQRAIFSPPKTRWWRRLRR